MGVICSRVRTEEKQIFRALQERGVPFQRIDVRDLTFSVSSTDHLPSLGEGGVSVVLIRCLSHTRALYAARMLEHEGVRTINPYQAIATCGDKVLTSMAMEEQGVPTARTAIALSQKAALAAVERMGYPVVVKPPVGSWGRLMAKVNDREAAEAILEHKARDGGARNGNTTFYVQDYVHKPDRDIRTLVVGDETIYAVYRRSSHWITNTARGGETSVCPVTPEIDRISLAAARAVGGEVVAVDLLEMPPTGDGGPTLLVNEVNHTPEFHGATGATDVDVAGRMVEYVLAARERGTG